MKQTAVEFLMEKLFDPSTMVQEQIQWFEQAKEMEREQIVNAFIFPIEKDVYDKGDKWNVYHAELYYHNICKETSDAEDKDELQDDWDVTLNDGIED